MSKNVWRLAVAMSGRDWWNHNIRATAVMATMPDWQRATAIAFVMTHTFPHMMLPR